MVIHSILSVLSVPYPPIKGEIPAERMVSMTNTAAIGYMIRAAKQANLSNGIIELLEALMLEQMDEYTEEEAERAYKRNDK